MDRMFAVHAGVEVSTHTGGTCPNDFTHSVSTELENKIVAEWRSVIVVSLNAGGGATLIKSPKLHVHAKHNIH